MPTLIVWGDDDKIIPPAYGPAFGKLIPGSKLEVIEKCGHLPQVEKADAFVAKIAELHHGGRRDEILLHSI